MDYIIKAGRLQINWIVLSWMGLPAALIGSQIWQAIADHFGFDSGANRLSGWETVAMPIAVVLSVPMLLLFWFGARATGEQHFEKDSASRLVDAAKAKYGVTLTSQSAWKLLHGARFDKRGTWHPPADGKVLRLGSALQLVDREALHVQLVWDGKELILVDLQEGPDSMVELVSWQEDVSF